MPKPSLLTEAITGRGAHLSRPAWMGSTQIGENSEPRHSEELKGKRAKPMPTTGASTEHDATGPNAISLEAEGATKRHKTCEDGQEQVTNVPSVPALGQPPTSWTAN